MAAAGDKLDTKGFVSGGRVLDTESGGIFSLAGSLWGARLSPCAPVPGAAWRRGLEGEALGDAFSGQRRVPSGLRGADERRRPVPFCPVGGGRSATTTTFLHVD